MICMTFLLADEVKPWITKLNNLTTFEKHVLIDKGTERAFSGKYVHTKEDGTYTCKVCDAPSICPVTNLTLTVVGQVLTMPFPEPSGNKKMQTADGQKSFVQIVVHIWDMYLEERGLLLKMYVTV